MDKSKPISPRVQEATDRAEALIKWFDDRPLPPSPCQLAPGELILDVRKFLDIQIGIIRANKVFSWGWGAALQRLQTFKNITDGQGTRKADDYRNKSSDTGKSVA